MDKARREETERTTVYLKGKTRRDKARREETERTIFERQDKKGRDKKGG